VIDRTGNILYVNQRLVDIVGVSREALSAAHLLNLSIPVTPNSRLTSSTQAPSITGRSWGRVASGTSTQPVSATTRSSGRTSARPRSESQAT
jgi:PAS domain-containing protein